MLRKLLIEELNRKLISSVTSLNFHTNVTSTNRDSSYFKVYLKQARTLQNSQSEQIFASKRERMNRILKKPRARDQNLGTLESRNNCKL